MECTRDSELDIHTLNKYLGRGKGGAVRRRLADVLGGEEGVVFEDGTSWAEGAVEGASRGMQRSKFCLSPAGILLDSVRLRCLYTQ